MGNQLNWVWEILALFLNESMAYYQARWFDAHMDGKTRFNHWPWGLFYMISLVFLYFIDHSIPLVVEVLLIRMIFFNISLNLLRRKVNLAIFYIHAAKENGSWIDRIELFVLGKWYPFFWAIELLAWIFLNIKFTK